MDDKTRLLGGPVYQPPMPCDPRVNASQPLVDLSDRRTILRWLQWNDKNGCYLDEMHERELGGVITLKEAQIHYACVALGLDYPDSVDGHVLDALIDMLNGDWRWPVEVIEPSKTTIVHRTEHLQFTYSKDKGDDWRIDDIKEIK